MLSPFVIMLKASCPVFMGKVNHRKHIGFEDPFRAKGNKEERIIVYRKIRDDIKREFYKFYNEELRKI